MAAALLQCPRPCCCWASAWHFAWRGPCGQFGSVDHAGAVSTQYQQYTAGSGEGRGGQPSTAAVGPRGAAGAPAVQCRVWVSRAGRGRRPTTAPCRSFDVSVGLPADRPAVPPLTTLARVSSNGTLVYCCGCCLAAYAVVPLLSLHFASCGGVRQRQPQGACFEAQRDNCWVDNGVAKLRGKVFPAACMGGRHQLP